jgi:hypothetical protein
MSKVCRLVKGAAGVITEKADHHIGQDLATSCEGMDPDPGLREAKEVAQQAVAACRKGNEGKAFRLVLHANTMLSEALHWCPITLEYLWKKWRR